MNVDMNGSCIIQAGTVIVGLGADGQAELRHDVGIRVDNGMIVQVGSMPAVSYGFDHLPRFGDPEKIAMPGLVNAHHHFGVTPLMQGVPFSPLELWLPQFRAFRPLDPRLDTLFSAIEMLESGTTMVHNINSGLFGTPDMWRATADATLTAYGEIGMRAGFSFMIRDRNILAYRPDAEILAQLPVATRDWLAPKLAAADIPIAELMGFFEDLRRHWAEAAPDHVRVNLAPANLHWCSDPCLDAIFGTARDAGAQIHMHLLETQRQAAFAQETYGKTAVAHLHDNGWLGQNVTLGHGNWMQPGDLDMLAECGCRACHNASSGLRLGSGIAPVNQMRQRGIPLALGIDQSNIADDRDMLLEMKLVWALHRETGMWVDAPGAAEIVQMATEHGAQSVGFGGFTGRIVPGQQADIVLMDRKAVERPFVNPRTPVADTILHRAGRQAVEQVFVGGRQVVDAGKVITVDRDAVLAEVGAVLGGAETAAETESWAHVTALMEVLKTEHRLGHPLGAYRPYCYNAMAG